MNRLLILILSSLISNFAQAEYRAFQLKIVNLETAKEWMAISTLDHIQYRQYYPLAKNEVAYYVTSWMCRGRTGNFRPICSNPKDINGQSPAAASP